LLHHRWGTGGQVGFADKPDYVNIRASVLFIPNEKPCYYPAAPDTGDKLVQVRPKIEAPPRAPLI